MSSPPDPLRTPAQTWQDHRAADVVIVGAGIAGLAFALRLPDHRRVLLVTKGGLGESNTRYAQGGLAAAIGPDDDPDLHFADTITAGAGLCDEQAVRTLVDNGPAAVEWLLAHGTAFDREDDRGMALGKEAAHSRNRVLHAGGDATGAEIERALVSRLRERPSVTVLDRTAAIDLVVTSDGTCAGVIVQADGSLSRTLLSAAVTVLANGGAGQLWAVTSNPPGATGDGVAMALRAAVAVADLEFTQFHPTVLAADGIEPFLITEAVRGEGAFLRSASGDRFMPSIHSLAELAPRDVVARAIQETMAASGDDHVYLDLRHLDSDLVRIRFPSISTRLAGHGIDLARDLVPVAPAAHYVMGGIVADTSGRTSLPGLLAIGEVSCTGVHGANRLASNSLLEGLVFGLRAADLAARLTGERTQGGEVPSTAKPASGGDRSEVSLSETRQALQRTMSRDVAVVRSAGSLDDALGQIDALAREGEPLPGAVAQPELRNMLLLAREVTVSALTRRESRGAHVRSDFPEMSPDLHGKHLIVTGGAVGVSRSFGPLSRAVSRETIEA